VQFNLCVGFKFRQLPLVEGRVVGRELVVRVGSHAMLRVQAGHGVIAYAAQALVERAAQEADAAELGLLQHGGLHAHLAAVGRRHRAQNLANDLPYPVVTAFADTVCCAGCSRVALAAAATSAAFVLLRLCGR
jgi:hypothetical protein